MLHALRRLSFVLAFVAGPLTAAPNGQSPSTRVPAVSTSVAMMMAQDGNGGFHLGQQLNSSCNYAGDPTVKVVLRCDADPLHVLSETAIAVDPNNPDHLLVGANDDHVFPVGAVYQASAQVSFSTSFDGGRNWTTGLLPPGGTGAGTADPVPVFNAAFGTAHMGHTGFSNSGSGGYTLNTQVSTSTDGGLTWGQPVVVARGIGAVGRSSGAIQNDKPWLVADNNHGSPFYGRLYLAWSRYVFAKVVEYPIYFAYSDDGGKQWSEPREISGSNAAYCTFAGSARCAYSFFPTPVVLPSGRVVVHFGEVNFTGSGVVPNDYDTQTMVVGSSDGGLTWSPPIHIAAQEDGAGTDYPLRALFPADYQATQTGHRFTTWSVQGMTGDPVTGALYAFWTDNRDGLHDVTVPVTQTNVFMTKSTDGGLSWVGPTRITSGPGDRWMPWGGAYGGTVRVMYMDGSYDMDRTHYGVTLASSSDGGTTWTFERVDPLPSSNPNYVALFGAGVADCYYCAGFIGDYQGMAVDSLGRAHIVWTDLSRPAYSGYDFKAEDVSYARR